jgi:NhaA family Na+:H+ antiporter
MRHIDPPDHRPVDTLLAPFRRFISIEGSGGIILLICTAVALLWANLAPAGYDGFWHTPIDLRLGSVTLANSLAHWVNDGLMAIFFFVVGLEIKREVLVGELASLKKAALPLTAALGGMIVPAVIYVAVNGTSGPTSRGWGIPMATDIAFALGVLALLGRRIPAGLVVFLAALAIADDIGAVLVIAIFYTAELSLTWLAVGVAAFLVAVIANRLGARSPITYGIIGVIAWLALLKSGVHATIAGVMMAMAIPARVRIDVHGFAERARGLIDRLRTVRNDETNHFATPEQMELMESLEGSVEMAMTPLQRFEHGAARWVAYGIMPVFALANAGVVLGGDGLAHLTGPISLGIIGGLVLGKQIGITLFAWLSVKAGIALLPDGVNWRHIYGAAWLGGIGFTMSLFVATLAFGESPELEASKIGILAASLLAGTVGYLLLKGVGSRE